MSKRLTKTLSLVEIFSANLRAARLRGGITQEELAALAGLHRTYVGSAERGERNVTLESVDRLARALRIAPSDLLSGKDS
ncbi:MAG TPA: helix-turn-helix transcriptional regulator [Gammaproteobacteria bacterium]|nr:helix-turn-helix transcriptional regulator [Gammaproteobacteria bacterium]